MIILLCSGMRTMKVSISRPRVYLIDFETAVQFPAECPLAERVSVGYPITFAGAENYARPHAPEFASGEAYSPFKLDVWQFGHSFSGFKVCGTVYFYCLLFSLLTSLFASQSTILTVDEVMASMIDIDPVHRLDAKEAKARDRLGTIVDSMAPESLLIRPDVYRHGVQVVY
jgi:serine/threonine protein kinase